MTECPCSKLAELVQRLLRDTETCVAAVPSLMPPSDIRAVLCVVRSTLGEPALFLYSLSPGTRGLALRDVLPLSTHALTLTAAASNSSSSSGISGSSGGSAGGRNTAVTVVVQRRKDGAKLVFETLVTPDADRRAQLATFAGMAETAARDIEVTEDTFGWVLRYKLSLFRSLSLSCALSHTLALFFLLLLLLREGKWEEGCWMGVQKRIKQKTKSKHNTSQHHNSSPLHKHIHVIRNDSST